MKEVLVVGQPTDRPCDHQQREEDERRNNSTPHIAVPCQRKREDTPDGCAENPAIVTSVDSRQNENRDKYQTPGNNSVTSVADCCHTLHREQRSPDQERK